ncbi:FHA domain-containing protein, partial [Paeniglutamicibacter sp.]|uniref:FHA domain-containing protein n=1 Tax=Paeniglutamicibacter sp. TaxID=1934391 RepID=UPI00398966FA
MRVLIRLDGQRLDRELGSFAPGTTLAQLVSSAGGTSPAPGSTLYVDAAAVPAETPLEELLLLEGSTISLAPVPRPEPVRGWSATVSGGLDAGALVPLPAHRPLVIGRSPQADLVLLTESASWNHASLEIEDDGVRVKDAGSTNGTLLAGEPVGEDGVLVTAPATLVIGGTTVLLRQSLVENRAPEPGSLHNLTPAATAPFNRPPRPGNPPEPDPLSPPVRKDVPPASKFSYITVLAPLLLAGAMVMMLGDARFAMFAALSPVMAVGMWFEQKHRRAKNLKEEDERFTAALADFATEVADAAAAQATRRHSEIPDPATAMRIAAVPTTGLWQRRTGSAGFLALNAGIGDVPWQPKLDDRSAPVPDRLVREALEASRIPAAPVLVDLTDAGVIGIVGDRAGALALARSLLTQAAVHAGPADLSIAVFCDRGRHEEWAWTSWLPHTRRLGTGTSERWLSDDRRRSAALLRALREGIDESPGGTTLLVLDSEVLTEGRDAPARELLGHGRSVPGLGGRGPGQGPRVSGIVIAASEQQLPASCTTVITVGADAAASVHDHGGLTPVGDVVLAGIGITTAARCDMDLAPVDDPDLV